MAATPSDVNNLFQTCGIDDIKIVERKIRSEIEKKKEDLRVMVGERYRDLINAADTIQDMMVGTSEVFSGISVIDDLCSSFDTVKNTNKSDKKVSESKEHAFYSLATQMDLLVDTPEKIWSALDTHQYLLAAQLYLFSQHIVNRSLNINVGQSRQNRDVYASFPILHHQWAAISHFKPSILKGGRTSLKEATLPDKALSESLCCISLLDNLSPRQMFTEFLMARKSAIQDVFHSSFHSISVKKQICDITYMLRLSIQQMITLFYSSESKTSEDAKPLFYKVLQDITAQKGPNTTPLFQTLFGNDVDVFTVSRYLPPTVSEFVPKLRDVPVSISVSYLQKHAIEWLSGSIKDVHHGVKNLLSFVNNIKGLAVIRDAVFELLRSDTLVENETANDEEKEKTWEEYCRLCLNRSLSIWDEFFRPLFVERAKIILEKQFSTCFSALSGSLHDVLVHLDDSQNGIDDSCWDHDLNGFTWHEFPQDFSSLLDSNAEGVEGMLSLKVKSFTPSIKRLCVQLNDSLHSILVDVKHFFCEPDEDKLDENERRRRAIKKDVQKLIFDSEDVAPNQKDPFEKYGDANIMKESLNSLFTEKVKELCKNINTMLNEVEKKLGSVNTDDAIAATAELDKATFLSRFCLGVPDLCYNIPKVIEYDSTLNKPQLKRQISRQLSRKHLTKKTEGFKTMEDDFAEQSRFGFSLWTKWIANVTLSLVQKTLSSSEDLTLFATTNWEDVTIEEENESGEKVKSNIRVPAQISFYLSSLLYRLAEEFHRVGGSKMDRQTISSLLTKIGESIFSSHESFVTEVKQKVLFQNKALQMIFDVKFVSKIFGGNTDAKDEALVKYRQHANKLIDELENFVDPFDLDVFTPHINTFVQRQLQRTSLIFGSISSLNKHSLQVSTTRISSLSQEEHSVVQLVSNPPRFMLLPMSGYNSKDKQDTNKVEYFSQQQQSSPLFLHQSQITLQGLV
ncbi:conserved oligomeric Golgi complex subunit 1-like [Hydractinia symbiolongicarpus]|uniref:conserved oligomeric Golgi complex subunit 1-like n=1 Tax=Hydractinia symbiolongicarpus TaxID=13093 RepID=UPI0025500B1D|nr:conserved oligomeric Golgi complex subunit 1-like [Hydractinia symbiolongicarpus]